MRVGRSKSEVSAARLLRRPWLKNCSEVLPPIPTEGLTAADIPDLAVRVHDQMVAALREISVPVASPNVPSESKSSPIPSDKPNETPRDILSAQAASALPAEPEPAQPVESLPQIPSRSESRASTQASEDTGSSPAQSRRSGSDNGTETEEDDGMVLVGRPK